MSTVEAAPSPAQSAAAASTPLKPLSKAGHYGNMNAEQKQIYADFEKKLTEQGALPNPALQDEQQRTIILS
jgi:hypothetical protein